MMETAPERVVDLVRDGRKIEAVKIVREETGASLKDALQAVEAIEAQANAATSHDPMPEVEALARDGRTDDAILLLHEHSGLGLKEAADVVDALTGPPEAPTVRIALVLGAAILALGLAIAVLLLASG